MSNKTDWKIPKLEIKEGEWYVCTNDWSDDGWLKFGKGDVVRAVRDNVFRDCYNIEHDFSVDGICYFRPADKDEIPEKYRLKDIELTEFEQALYDYNIEGESFICGHDEIECKHEVRRIAGELLPLARKMLEGKIRHEVRSEMFDKLPHWKEEYYGVAGGGDRERYLIRTARGCYFTSKCIGGTNHYLLLEDLENLPGLPKED